MKKLLNIGRRGFIGGTLLALGAVIGWFSRKFQGPSAVRETKPSTQTSRFVYDMSEFEKTDPKLLMYEAGPTFITGFKRVDRIALDPFHNHVLVAGDRAIRCFQATGDLIREIPLERPPHCLFVSREKEWFVGLGNHFEIYDREGNQKVKSPRLPGQAFLTSIVAHEGRVYLADAGNREILVCDQEGNLIDRFGKKDSERNNPGFAVPSPYFDLELTDDFRLLVANTGRLRMETYTLDGQFEASWGGPGMRIDRFCGCCNPVYFTQTQNGHIITSEKGLERINIYEANGTFKGAVAGPLHLSGESSQRSRKPQSIDGKGGFDIAINEAGIIFALDPHKQIVRSFVPKKDTVI